MSVKRLTKFLLLEELDPHETEWSEEPLSSKYLHMTLVCTFMLCIDTSLQSCFRTVGEKKLLTYLGIV